LPRIDDFQNALNLARERLSLRDPEEICHNAGAELSVLSGGKIILFPFFLNKIIITYPEGQVRYQNEQGNLSLQEQGLILHYLLGVSDASLTGELITFREIPSGEFYYQPFLNRAQVPLVNTFGTDHELFQTTGKKLGGKEAGMGDVSLIFHPFPKVPVTLVLWKGDQEFAPDGTVLFDSSIKYFLAGEDVAFLAGTVVYKLMALSKN
jgi:hypothetical protein